MTSSIVNSNLAVNSTSNISHLLLLSNSDLNINDDEKYNVNDDNNKKGTFSLVAKKRKNANNNSKKNINNNSSNSKKKKATTSSVKMNTKNNNVNTKKRKAGGNNNNETKKQVSSKKNGKQTPTKSFKRKKRGGGGDKIKITQLERASREEYLNNLMMGNGTGNNMDVFNLRNKLSPSISPQMPIAKTISLSPPMMNGQAPSFYSGYHHQSVGETMGVECTGTLFLPIENGDVEQIYRTPTPGLTDFTIKSSTPIRGVDSWDNVGKLFDKKRMPTPSSFLQKD